MAKDLFNRYVWLVDTIYRAGGITFEEINERWMRSAQSQGEELPLRTFHNHRKAIEDLFDINIECDKRDGYKYYIENAEDIKSGGVRQWLLNTFAVNNLISESHKLKSRILFEHIPSGQQYLAPIIEAMRDGLTIEMTYKSFWNEENTFDLEPYCVKVFRQRWYVIGRSPYYDKIMVYALDRIRVIFATDKGFKLPESFEGDSFFRDSFGITVNDGCEAEQVELRVQKDQVRYFRTLPLHHSQKETIKEDNYSVFHYHIKPTYDFRQEILSHGDKVEVLAPAWLRDEMNGAAVSMAAAYAHPASDSGAHQIATQAHIEIERSNGGRETIIITALSSEGRDKIIGKFVDLINKKQIEGISFINDSSEGHNTRVEIILKSNIKATTVLTNLKDKIDTLYLKYKFGHPTNDAIILWGKD